MTSQMHVVIVGNGILGLTTAYRVVERDPGASVTVIGPAHHRGCASLAAAAMFNSFCELEPNTLANPIERQKWLFNKAATAYWPDFLRELQTRAGMAINNGFGTFLINNHTNDTLEDENFDAVVAALQEFNEPFAFVHPREIPKFRPSPRSRASRAIQIPAEGWVNPLHLIEALKQALMVSGRVQFVDANCQSLTTVGSRVIGAVVDTDELVQGDIYLLSPGATFSQIVDASHLPFSIQPPRIFYGVGCSLLLETGSETLTNCVRTPNRGLACGVYAAPQTPSRTLIGASNFISPVPEDGPRLTSVHTLLGAAMDQINANYFRVQLIKVNVGWRPTSQDTLPLLGKTSLDNLLVATGTKRDGLHCSPLISENLVALMFGDRPTFDLSLFRPEREPVRTLTREEAIETAVRHSMNAAYQHGFTPSTSRMVDDLIKTYRADVEAVHDTVGALEWGIPPEMLEMYRYGQTQ